MYILRSCPKKSLKVITVLIIGFVLLLIFGVFHHPLEKNFYSNFHYPYDGDLEPLILELKNNKTPSIPRLNDYNFYYYKNCDGKCRDTSDLRLVYIIKSAPQNFERRLAIRSSWGFQRRFSDVEIRTVFLIGLQKVPDVQVSLNEESGRYHDIVQANYTDSYYNNTFKTMSGFEWVMRYCPNAKFYMFIDDDYYISTKNVLRYLRFPINYPQYLQDPIGSINKLIELRKVKNVEIDLEDDVRLYTGFKFQSAPQRNYLSKWYVSLEEYSYHMWPPYISGGAYILSKTALQDMYYASFYMRHFKFDDIYVAILAYKTNVEPFHSKYFHFYEKPYNKFNYKYVVASHGYGDPKKMVKAWNEQKSMGNA
ncbi:beta-1,3-galactosyltransferase brn [Euwallacea fornicatus]|uniref:beta-1,3-galactosyltransferase brn n=1 Tax=Euwallacea fornicatus TaxID=995702 RepID=UPI00338D7010